MTGRPPDFRRQGCIGYPSRQIAFRTKAIPPMHISLTAIRLSGQMSNAVPTIHEAGVEAVKDPFSCRLVEFMAAGFGSISAMNVTAPTYAARR